MLPWACLVDADLTEANCDLADFYGAVLVKAICKKVDFHEAILERTDLRG